MDIQVGISNNFEVVTLNNRVQSLILQILQQFITVMHLALILATTIERHLME